MSKMKLVGGFACVLLIMIVLGCASASSVAPEWVTNPESAYNSKEYLLAVGSGDNKKDAESDALSLLARSIQQNVVATTESSKTFDGNDNSGFNTNYDYEGTVIAASSIKDIPGVTFPQTWIAKNGTVYTLALLNRQEAGKYYRQKIADLTAVVESEIVFADRNKGSFAALTALQNTVETARENQLYLDTLAGINPSMYHSISLDYGSAQAVEVLAARQKEHIVVAVDVEGDSNGRIASVLEDILSDLGLKAAAASDTSAAYLFRGKVTMSQLQLDNKYEYARFVIDVDLVEKASGKVLFPYSKNGREAHVSYSEAVQRAYRTLESTLKKEFTPQFLSFVNSSAE